MTLPTTAKEAVLAANATFYAAMRNSDLVAMRTLWARHRRVSCTHPSGPALFGRAAVMESWRLILEEGAPPDIEAVGVQVVVTGATALVLCEERIGGVSLMASNVFAIEDGRWRMVSHQASALAGNLP
ncbi:MAG: nuclear transport factor 2 family protein [Paracoccaceae bacterium]